VAGQGNLDLGNSLIYKDLADHWNTLIKVGDVALSWSRLKSLCGVESPEGTGSLLENKQLFRKITPHIALEIVRLETN